jgi:hypothetical protein
MKKLALVGCLVSAFAFAADKPAAPPADAKMGGMMEGWTPRKVTKEDKKAVTDALEAMHTKMMSGASIDEMAAMNDFPIFMMTDDKDGNVMATMMDQAAWKKMMEPGMKSGSEKEMHDQMAKMPKPKMDVSFLTDNMALVTAKMMMPMGKEKMEVRNAHIMILKDGKWMVKGMIEGGWGDMAKKQMGDMKADMAKPGMEMKPKADATQPMKK